MDLCAGTSGFSYKAWRGSFYPEDLPAGDMLAHYSRRLPAVEINNTFYRMPRPEMLEAWAAQVPEGFRFVLKASRRITHNARLAGADDSVRYLWEQARHLGPHLGPILFQLPPNLRADVPRLRAFVAALPAGCRGAFEFRHPSWLEDEETAGALREAGHALCVADAGEGGQEPPPLLATADWGYLRLRRERYTDEALEAWVARIRAQPWREVYVFFKHEDEGAAPALASRLSSLFDASQERGNHTQD